MTETMIDRVIDIITKSVGIPANESLDGNTSLVGSGLSIDSVAVLEILTALENEFEIEIDANELLKATALETIDSLAGFVREKLERL